MERGPVSVCEVTQGKMVSLKFFHLLVGTDVCLNGCWTTKNQGTGLGRSTGRGMDTCGRSDRSIVLVVEFVVYVHCLVSVDMVSK